MNKYIFFAVVFGLFGPALAFAGTQAPQITAGPTATPPSFNTDNGVQDVVVQFSATDDDSGICVRTDGCNYPSIARVEDASVIEVDIVRVSGTDTDGMYEVPLTFAQYADINQSSYADNDLMIFDKNGNEQRVAISSILVNTGTMSDTIGPVIESINSTTPSVVTPDSSRSVDVRLRVTDATSGVCAQGDGDCEVIANIWYSDPDDVLEDLNIQFFVGSFVRISGNENDGEYSLTYHVPSATPHGTYQLFIELPDKAGNYSQTQGGAFTLTVSDHALVDTTVDNVIHRFYSTHFQSHFYTISAAEANHLILNDAHWQYEGPAYEASPASMQDMDAVYRFYSPVYQSHFYTMSESERDGLIANDPNWQYEGVAYYTYTSSASDREALYRFYSANYQSHFYTTSESERDGLIANDPNWQYEGIAWYVQR